MNKFSVKRKNFIFVFFSFLLLFFSFTKSVFAHEAYVLDKTFFWNELSKPFSTHALDALKDINNVHITILVVSGVLLLLALNFLFMRSETGKSFGKKIESFSYLGPIFIRGAIAASFFYSAVSWSFLGPELSIQAMPFALFIRLTLFISSFLIAIGLFTEIAALASFICFLIGFHVFGLYLLTYFNYLGEIIVLLLFGMRKWSVDSLLFGKHKLLERWKKYETSVIRVFYGIALSYAAITVKFLHPALTIDVVKNWHLTKFYLLFPHDPLLVALGAGLAEVAIGIFIIFGFEMRLTVIISLFYITLSLLYFRELVWPHLMLYGISFNLILQPEVFTLDHLITKGHREKWWKRPFLPHIKI